MKKTIKKFNKKKAFYILILFCFHLNCYSNEFLKSEVPLSGKILKFSDKYGECDFHTDIITYKTEDFAEIEATMLTPVTTLQKPGLLFVHMWARDRNTFWGLPEFLATHGYPSIYLDLRGHGNSKLPPPYAKKKIKTKDKYGIYSYFYRDITNAIPFINNNKTTKKDNLILISASLGCPLGIIAVNKNKNQFIGMIHLAPSITYFDVDCSEHIKNIKEIPVYVIADENDISFKKAKNFFETFTRNKTFLSTKGIGHGTDILYNDLQVPTLILTWIQQIEIFHPVLKKLKPDSIKSSN